MKKYRTKNEAKKNVRDAIKAFDGDMKLFPMVIEAEGDKPEEYTGKVILENTKAEAAQFVEKHGDEFNIELGKFDKDERNERRKVGPKPSPNGRGSRIPPDAGIVPRDVKAGVDDDDPTANPRRENTFGHASFAILQEHWSKNKNAAMRYEDYIKTGGRPNDLRWDWEKGNVNILNPKTGKPAAGIADFVAA